MRFDALDSIRVLDLGIITAGASTSAILADLGAEVIKIEGPGYTDPFRVWKGANGERWWNESPHFAFTNRHKKSCCIDLKSTEGRQLFLDLAAVSHIVVENFRVGVLPSLGLGFEDLAARNPEIVLASISSQGLTGPDADSVSFGSTLEGSSGLASLIREPDGHPQISGHALNYPDQVVSLFAAGAIMAALVDVQRRKTGVLLDISQRELTIFMLGEMFDGGPQPDAPAFQAIVASRDNRWVAITILDAAEVDKVAVSLGLAAPLSAGSISKWARQYDAETAAATLRRGGAAAAVARRSAEMVREAAEHESDAVAFAPDGEPSKGLPWRIGGERLSIERKAATLGADNEYVVRNIAGRTAEDYHRLVESGVLTTEPRAARRIGSQ